MIKFNDEQSADSRAIQPQLTTAQELQAIEIINGLLLIGRVPSDAKMLPPLQAFIWNYENMAHYVACTQGMWATETPEVPGSCFQLQFSNLPAKQPKKFIDELVAHLEESKAPGSYYYGWQANIAMAFVDVFQQKCEECPGLKIKAPSPQTIHKIANTAAQHFLDTLIGQKKKEEEAVDAIAFTDIDQSTKEGRYLVAALMTIGENTNAPNLDAVLKKIVKDLPDAKGKTLQVANELKPGGIDASAHQMD